MKLVRLRDLSASFTDDGRVLVRSPGHGFGARVPAFAVGVLAFCSVPRSEPEVATTFGPRGAQLFRGLAEAGLLVDPAEAAKTPMFFANFSAVDIHRRMLADTHRVQAYRRALEALAPGKAVLDAGTGSGVLAGLAALAGASRVVAVDNADVVEVATENMRRSGLSDVVTVVRGDVAEVQVDEPVDLIVTETFGAMALAEGSVEDLARCAAHTLTPDGQVIPSAIDFYLAPVSDPSIRGDALGPFDSVDGLDLSALSDTAKRRAITLPIPDDALLAPGGRFCRLPYPTGGPVAEGSVEIQCPAGTLVGLAGWFDLQMTPDQVLSTAPDAPPTHWAQSFFPLGPLELDEGDILSLSVTLGPAPDDRRGCVMELAWHVGDQSGEETYRLR